MYASVEVTSKVGGIYDPRSSFEVAQLSHLCLFPYPRIHSLVFFRPSAFTWIAGLCGGLLWANWFEYAYHRWLDHTPGLYWEKEHRKHHSKPEDEDHVNLGSSPFDTFLMFAVN